MNSAMNINLISSVYFSCVFLHFTNFACTTEVIKLPENFTIGAGNSAYQVEGAWNASDKGESNLDVMYRNSPENGQIACDFYHKYKEDIQIAKDIGLNYFRMSVSWTRILPNGSSNNISQNGIQYYHNVIDEIKAKGMEPFVTIYHWDHPKSFDEFKAWEDDQMINYFTDYAEILFKNFGSKVKFWTTINEPNIYCKTFSTDLKQLKCGHTMLKAHARVYHLYDEKFRATQGGKIGITNACLAFFSADSNSNDCVSTAFEENCGWMYNPIFSKDGDWSQLLKTINKQIAELFNISLLLPSFSLEEIEYIRGTSDYLGLNYYTAQVCQTVPESNATNMNYARYRLVNNETWEHEEDSFVYIVPAGLRSVLKLIKEKYNNPLVYILENGYPDTHQLNDVKKIKYLYSHIREAIFAQKFDGCNVEKYIIWNLLDNFEWKTKYSQKWGLVQVNFDSVNLTRTPRLSAKWLQKVIQSRELFEYNDKMKL